MVWARSVAGAATEHEGAVAAGDAVLVVESRSASCRRRMIGRPLTVMPRARVASRARPPAARFVGAVAGDVDHAAGALDAVVLDQRVANASAREIEVPRR